MIQFVERTPDFFDGVKHLVQSRDRELQTMGMSDKQQRITQIAKEEKILMQQAFAENRSAAAVLYELARQRGFAGGRQPQAPQVPQPSRCSASRLASMPRRAFRALAAQQLADMPEDQFAELIKRMGGISSPAVQRAFGGGG